MFILRGRLWLIGDEILKTKRGFCSSHNHSQKPLSCFTHVSRFERYNLIFAAYCSGFLIFSCFSVHIAGKIRIDWRWNFKNKERFFFIKYPFTKTSLIFYTGVKVWKIQLNLCSLFLGSLNIQYFPVSVFILRGRFWSIGDEILQTKRGFCPSRTHLQKPLSVFTQVS